MQLYQLEIEDISQFFWREILFNTHWLIRKSVNNNREN
jgi:hypothetical protein